MSRSNPPPPRFDCMGDFGDEDQRPAKRVRLDTAGAAAPPNDGQQDGCPDAWGTSQVINPEWLFPQGIMIPGSLPMSMPGSLGGIIPNSDAPMPMTAPMTAPMATPMAAPMDNPMISAPWEPNFDIPPNPADISASFPSQPQTVVLPVEELQTSPQSQPQRQVPPQLQSQPPLSSQKPPRDQPPPRPRHVQPSKSPVRTPDLVHHEQRRRKSRSKHSITSPFVDCLDSFGRNFSLKRFARPLDGKINGYIKCSWPQKKNALSAKVIELTDPEDEMASSTNGKSMPSKHSSEMSLQRRNSASPSVSAMTLIGAEDSPLSTASTLVMTQAGLALQSPTGSLPPYFDNDATENPRPVPPHFGHMAVMDSMDRKLFKFYLNNWCPGRSVLKDTNLWLTDFARMHDSPGVLSAIQSLAGIYVHDYLPDEIVRRRINERFAIAESRLTFLLQDPASLGPRESSELITLASLLSMQDIVLTERRLKKPYHPRWLTGFKQGEQMLHITDPGNRFYKESNVQVDALRLSQSVIVGRAVILAQPMMPLPPTGSFDAIAEAGRFSFLLYGSQREMFEIHGGCGFSKRLLHIFSQVAYCSARMLQDGETPIVPVTADMLYNQLLDLHQWSVEYSTWENATDSPQPIEWIRLVDDSYVVQKPGEMTEVTAEAWRLAGMVYLQCRLLRLPRNHPEVVANLADLAKSISIMPTSGSVFTAQAPLLPVFLLGLLATVEEHVEVAHAWFQQVIRTPVRSSVPPLYEALERIQSWMHSEIPTPAPNMKLPGVIAERQPWWERMVSKVQEKEMEVLCLT